MYSIFDSSRSPLALWLYTLKIVLCLAELLLAHGVIGAGGVGQSPFPLPFKVELSSFSCGDVVGHVSSPSSSEISMFLTCRQL